jgi:hypothetical protein
MLQITATLVSLLLHVLTSPVASTPVALDDGKAAGVVPESAPVLLDTAVRSIEYHFTQDQAGRWVAPNRQQGVRAVADDAGVYIEARGALDWAVRLSTVSFGLRGATEALGQAQLSSSENRVEFSWGGISEWFINQPTGIKQGWTLANAAHGDVWVGLEVDGLGFRIAADGLGGDFISADGVVKLRASGLVAFDAQGRQLSATYASGQDGLGIIVRTDGASFPITIDPLLTSSVWQQEFNQAHAGIGMSLTAAGDINGDGISDILVGAPYYDGPLVDCGAVFVAFGSNSGLPTLSVPITGNQAGSRFGASVAGVGDLNADGFGDVVIGAPAWDEGEIDEGAVFVYFGSSSGLQPNALGLQINQASAAFGASVAYAGDVNRDGFPDILVGAPLFSNQEANEGAVFLFKGGVGGVSPLTPYGVMEANIVGAHLGTAVSGANDINSDGFMDVVAGAPSTAVGGSLEAGAVHVWLGTALGAGGMPSWSSMGSQPGGRLGTSVAGIGDANGDGHADIAVGAPHYSSGQASEGAVFVYHGGGNGLHGPAWTYQSNQVGANCGAAVSAAGDINGDGYADLIVGVPNWDGPLLDQGAVNLHHGGPNGLTTTANQVLLGLNSDSRFGASLCGAGDTNNDGYADVMVGAPNFSNGEPSEGGVYGYYGMPSSISSAAQWNGTSGQVDAEYGTSVAFLGDLNGDGYSDHAVSAYRFDLPGSPDIGRVYIYLGGPFSSAPVLAGTINGEQPGDRFGNCVAAAGDINRDGYSDFLVGARLADTGSIDAGKIYLYYGSSAGFDPTPIVRHGDQAGAKLGHWLSGIGDINGDGFGDIAASEFQYDVTDSSGSALPDAGRVLVWHGSRTGISVTPNRFLPGQEAGEGFGSNVAAAGDVNRDGFCDLVIGSYLPAASGKGRAVVYQGSAGGIATGARWQFELPQAGATLTSACGVGDLNGDGYSDLVLGSPNFTPVGAPWAGTGQAFVFLGGQNGLPDAPSSILAEIQPLPESSALDAPQGYGLLATGAGDVNNDGYSDLLVSANGWNDGEVDEGKVFVYLGSASGIQIHPYWTTQMDQAGCQLGISISGGGDTNGDGFGDLLLGIYRYSFFAQAEGYATLHCGNGDVRGGASVRPRMRQLTGGPIAPGGGTSELEYKIVLDHVGHASQGGVAGRSQVRLAYENRAQGVPFSGSNLTRGVFIDSHAGTVPLALEGSAGWASMGRMNWRSRFETKHPSFCNSIWYSLPLNSLSPYCIRVQTDCNANQIIDELDLDVFTPESGYPGCKNGPDGIPDECQPFGNSNVCGDVMHWAHPDADNDGVPNACEIMLGALDQVAIGCWYVCASSSTWDEWVGVDGIPDAGFVRDLNNNGISDTIEIAIDPSLDRSGRDICPYEDCAYISPCDPNGILDSVEKGGGDCDGNHCPDYYQILNYLNCTGYPWPVDCNGNWILDVCEISSGALQDVYSLDWDSLDVLGCVPDGVPDICQAPISDCNLDNIPDECNILFGAGDCDADQVLDQCEIGAGAVDVNLNGVPDSCETQVVAYCFGDQSGQSCPCGLVSAPGVGCPNSAIGNTGARLRSQGLPSSSVGDFRLIGTDMTPSSSVLYFQGTALQSGGAGALFGDGLRCVSGSVLRLGTTTNASGTSFFPPAGSQPIRVLGQIPSTGGVTRYYQAWYRDSNPNWCTANRFNLTNGVSVTWIP